MRLGFYYHIPAIRKNDQIFMPGYLGRFLDSLADRCESLLLFQHLPNSGEMIEFDYAINSTNIQWISLPSRRSVPYRVFHSQKYTSLIRDHKADMDAILLRGPSPLLPSIARTLRPVKSVFLIVGDQLAGVDSLCQPRWRKELIRIWSWYNEHRQFQAARYSLVFVNSKALYRKFLGRVVNLQETRTTTLNENDFYLREDTCLNRPVKLLYSGRLDPAKGLLEMVETVSLLVKQGEDIVLNLVGWAESGSNIIEQLKALAAERNITDRIIFHGYKAVGSELFDFYKHADIYLIASQSSFEGFPRTIWEAMAHSLPVVATKVGSIPDFISGAAELVKPRDPAALAAAISKLIATPSLRQKYIRQGFSLASQNTLEIQVRKMVDTINKWMELKNE